MKHVRAVFRPAKLYDVVTALRAIPSMPLFTMTEVRGIPGAAIHRESPRQGPREMDSIEMLEIECLIPEELLPGVVDALEAAGRTTAVDESKIFVIEAVEIAIARSTH